jgi:murein DD-endopeptidase MepM/ murein hydrolase activator NlpD
MGIQLRMAHLSSVLIKNGRIPAGTSFARVGTSGRVTGPHIHLEYDTKKGTRGGGAINDDPNYASKLDQYVRLLYLTSKPIGRAFSGTTP